MSTQLELTRLQTARNKIRTWLVSVGLATSTDKLDVLATAIDGITNQGAVDANVKEGETYAIPKGYHNGSGTVKGVAGGGNYNLQSKTVTPTKSQQNVAPDQGYYGLSAVTVNAIPEAYQDTSSVTAGAGDVRANKIIVTAEGEQVAGTLADNGSVNKTLDAATGNQEYTISSGIHSGSGKVKIVLEEKAATPAAEAQDITPSTGKVLGKVTVAAIPEKYADTSDSTGTAADILDGKIVYGYDSTGKKAKKLTGTMPDNGAVSKTLDATTGNQTYTVPAGKHSGTGSVQIVLETKQATPTKSVQEVTPTAGKVLSKVTVEAIPAKYQDVSGVTATAAHVLDGDKFVDATGAVVTGTMANNGAVSKTMDGLTTTSVTIEAGYTSGGTVSLTDDIETALAAI